MDWKTFLLTATLGVAGVAAVAACASGGDDDKAATPDGGGGNPPPGGGDGVTQPPPGTGEPDEDAGEGEPDAGGSDEDGGGGKPDGGGGGGGNVFSDAPDYAKTIGPTARNAAHRARGFFNGNPAGEACFNCHTQFQYAGTVYADLSDPAKLVPAAGVEVRLTVEGKSKSVYTDEDGNFYANGAPHTGGGKTGARNEASTNLMKISPFNGNCNGCHNGSSQPRIHVP